MITGTGFTIALYQSVSHPLAKLREGTKKIGRGNWNLKLDIMNPPELGELARSFEEMAKSLSNLQTQVVQMDRMSAVGTLAGGVAHEINNPLTGVLGQAQILLIKMSPEDPNRTHVEHIESAAQRCRKIVRGLLDFSRPSDYSFEPADVETIILAALSLCESEIAALRIHVIWQKNPLLPKVLASANHMQQVFLNIITNAMHAMPDGGNLTIETEEVPPHPDPLLKHVPPSKNLLGRDCPKNYRDESATASPPVPRVEREINRGAEMMSENHFVQISFKDTGIGIQPEHLPKLFDPFFTTKEPGKGTGLGLTISYGIVQRHQGQIEAQSEGAGRGATFIVRLPAAETEEADMKSLEEAEKRLARFETSG